MLRKNRIIFFLMISCICYYTQGQIKKINPSSPENIINVKILNYIYKDDTNSIRKYLSEGIDVDRYNISGNTLLMYATKYDKKNIISLFDEYGADLNKGTKYGETPLIYTVKNDSIFLTEFLILLGADINKADKMGVTPLMYAVMKNYIIMTDMLLYYEADVSISDFEKMTSLMYAAFNGHFEITKLLLEAGANVKSVDKYGSTALHYACEQNHEEIVSLLLDYGSSPNKPNKDKDTPLYFAVKNGNHNIIKNLLDHGANPNIYGSGFYSPLYVAVNNKDIKSVRLLLENDATTDVVVEKNENMLGYTYKYRSKYKNDSIVQYLKEYKTNRNVKPKTELGFGVLSSFDVDGLFGGFNLGVREKMLNLSLYTEVAWTPFPGMNEKAFFSVGLDKNFKIINNINPPKGPAFNLSTGIKKIVGDLNYTAPRVGLMLSRHYQSVAIHFEFPKLLSYQQINQPDFRLSVSFFSF